MQVICLLRVERKFSRVHGIKFIKMKKCDDSLHLLYICQIYYYYKLTKEMFLKNLYLVIYYSHAL